MSGFSAEWLALREPADVEARLQAASVTHAVTAALPVDRPVRVVDLGCGTGSNVRFLASRLGSPVHWRLVDHDEALLAHAARLLGSQVETRVVDLRVLSQDDIGDADLVTASALLDLVSDAWLSTFVHICRRANAAVLIALNYDGRVSCSPADDDDEFVRDLVNGHQRTDKGFGPALGPESGTRTAEQLTGAGYTVHSAKSDWVIGADRAELQRQLIEGWARAAIELSPDDRGRILAWQARRLQHVNAGISQLIVGHDDVAGILNR